MGKQVLNVVFGEKSYLSYFFPNMRYGLYIFQLTFFLSSLKRSQEIFDLFLSKNSTWAPLEQAKTILRNFSFSQRYSRKTCVRVGVAMPTRCPRSHWLHQHGDCEVIDNANTWQIFLNIQFDTARKLCVCIVVDYANRCQRSRWLCRHVPALLLTTLTRCLCTLEWPRGHQQQSLKASHWL